MPLQSLMSERNITVRQLARQADIPYSTLKDICDGRARFQNSALEAFQSLYV